MEILQSCTHHRNNRICKKEIFEAENFKSDSHELKKNPWITMGMMNSIKLRDKLYKL